MKNKLPKLLAILALLTVFLMALTACNGATIPTLPAPSGLTVIDGVLRWNSVSGANAYIVNQDGLDIATVSDIQYALTGLSNNTTYVFKVKAKHTLGVYNDSLYSDSFSYKYVNNTVDNPGDNSGDNPGGNTGDNTGEKPNDNPGGNIDNSGDKLSPLLSPENISINEGIITWNAVENATSYVVSINGKEYASSRNELNITSLDDGIYNIKVKAVGDGKTYANSEYCKEEEVNLYNGSVCTTEQFGNFKDINQFESFLGYGFDVVADSVVSDRTVLTSFPIFNVDELMNLRFLKVNSKASQVKIISEDSMESFSEQWNAALNVNVSMSGAYSGVKVGGSIKLKEEFSVAVNTAKSTYYYCITITDQKFYIVMQGDMDTYRSMLSAGFIKDLYDKNVDPAALFQRYGTHFITSAVMGGRMNAYYNMYSFEESVNQQAYVDVSTAISVSFNELFSMNSDISFNQSIQSAKARNKINTKESVDVMGGADLGIASVSQVPERYNEWQKSLNDYPSLMGIKDSSSLIGIWELIDSSRDADDSWTWIDENGEEKRGTRAQQLQAYFYKYGLENYNQLMLASSLPETVKPEAIGNILINGNGVEKDGYYSVDADSVNALTFTVLPDNATGYTKTYSLDEESKKYAYIENGELVVRPSAVIPKGTVLYITVAAGNVQRTLRLRVIRKYNITYNLNFPTDYAVADTIGILEGSAITPPVLMSKTDGTDNDVAIDRFGYRLIGWASYSDGEYVTYDFSKPVMSNLNLFAQWQKITNVFAFDAQGGMFDNGQTSLTNVIDYNMYAECPDNPSRDHYEFVGWFTEKNGNTLFDFENTPILKKTTVYAKWVATRYTVTVNLNNGIADEKAYTSAESNFVISLNEPTKLYYDFQHWALIDGTEINLGSYQFKQNTAIKAVYTPTLYIVTFNTDGGSVIKPMATSVETNFTLNTIVATPQKEGYTFKAWRVYLDNAYTEIEDLSVLTIKSNITATAIYEINRYTVSFNSNGGNSVSPYENVEHGMTIIAPTAPTKDGYEFVGWHKDEEHGKRFSFEADKITADITLHAVWTKEPLKTVTFFTNIPNKTFEPIMVEWGSVLSTRYTEDMNAEYEGYRFDGWFTDENLENSYNADSLITSDVVLYAKWVALSYTIEFVADGKIIERKTYLFDTEVSVPEAPEKEGHTFIGWSEEIPERMPASNKRIYADYAPNSYTVSYLVDNESYHEKTFTFGEKVTVEISDPEKTGYTFTGWDSELPAVMPAHDVAITAEWSVNSYIITYYLTNSTEAYTEKFTEIEVEYGTFIDDITITDPKPAEGYDFVKWEYGAIFVMPAENIEAYAIFERKTLQITLNYGNNSLTTEAVYGTLLTEVFAKASLKDSTYLFDGTWNSASGAKVSEYATVPSENATYTANYSVKKTTYMPSDIRVTDTTSKTREFGSIYLSTSDLPELNHSVLTTACGAVALDITFNANQDIIFDVISDGDTLFTNTTGSSNEAKSLSYKVNVGYQALRNGVQLRFTEGYFKVLGIEYSTKLDIVISNVRINVSIIDNYCVEFNGKLYFYDTPQAADSIAYIEPKKAAETQVFVSSPTKVTRYVEYTFNYWQVGNSKVAVVGNKLQLSPLLDKVRHIKVTPYYTEKYSAYKAVMYCDPSYLETDAKLYHAAGYYETKWENRSRTTVALSKETRDIMMSYGFKKVKMTILFDYHNTNDATNKVEGYLNNISRNYDSWGVSDGTRSSRSLYIGEHDIIYADQTVKFEIWAHGKDKYNKWDASNIRVQYEFTY